MLQLCTFSDNSFPESVEEVANEYIGYGKVSVFYGEDIYNIGAEVLNKMGYLLS